MKNNKFLQSTLILIIGTFITRAFGFIIRILYTRIIGTEGISLYSIIMPTYSLLVTIASFGMPIAISKMVSEGKIRSKYILSQGVYLLLFINILFMLIIISCSSFIANTLLNEPRVKVLLIGATLSMPNMAIACVLKGYFYGKQRMLPNTISNVIEQVIRLLFLIFLLPYFTEKSVVLGILSFLLINVVTEGASIITFLCLLPKNTEINLKDLKYDKGIANTLFQESYPLITGKIIGSIGFFLEPIILSNTFKSLGYDSSFFTREYGIYNGYSLSLLLLPAFFITALCTAIIPEIAKYYSRKKYKMVQKRVKQSIFISLLFGIITTLFIYFNRDYLLMLIYNTDKGSEYIKALSIFFVFYYLEAPLSSILQAISHAKYATKITTIGVIIKLLAMFIFTRLRIGLYGLIIAEAINIIFIVYKDYRKINRVLKRKIKNSY